MILHHMSFDINVGLYTDAHPCMLSIKLSLNGALLGECIDSKNPEFLTTRNLRRHSVDKECGPYLVTLIKADTYI